MTLKNLFVSDSVAEDSNESIDDSNEDIAGLQVCAFSVCAFSSFLLLTVTCQSSYIYFKLYFILDSI